MRNKIQIDPFWQVFIGHLKNLSQYIFRIMQKSKNGGLTQASQIFYQFPKKDPINDRKYLKMLKQMAEETGTLSQALDKYPQLADLNYEEINQFQDENQENFSETRLTTKKYNHSMLQIFIMLSQIDGYNKIYGNFIIDDEFNFICADQLAKQMLENAFCPLVNHKLTDFVVAQDRKQFIKKCNKSIYEQTWFDYVVYSKMSTRRFEDEPQLQNPNNLDYFFRYLKSLKSQVTAVTIDFTNFYRYASDILWSQQLFEFKNPKKCYIFRTTWSEYIPNLEKYRFEEDKKIMRFKKCVQTKLKKKQKSKIEIEIGQQNNWMKDYFAEANSSLQFKQFEVVQYKDPFQFLDQELSGQKINVDIPLENIEVQATEFAVCPPVIQIKVCQQIEVQQIPCPKTKKIKKDIKKQQELKQKQKALKSARSKIPKFPRKKKRSRFARNARKLQIIEQSPSIQQQSLIFQNTLQPFMTHSQSNEKAAVDLLDMFDSYSSEQHRNIETIFQETGDYKNQEIKDQNEYISQFIW